MKNVTKKLSIIFATLLIGSVAVNCTKPENGADGYGVDREKVERPGDQGSVDREKVERPGDQGDG